MELDVTPAQALFLNQVSRNASAYRLNAERLKDDLDSSLKRVSVGKLPNALRHQEVSEVIQYQAKLEALDDVVFTVFPFPAGPYETEAEAVASRRSHEDLVSGYLKTAMNMGRMAYITAKNGS